LHESKVLAKNKSTSSQILALSLTTVVVVFDTFSQKRQPLSLWYR